MNTTTAPTRKIAYLPALAAYYSLPLAYQPALVTEEDAREDSRIELAGHVLARLADHSLDGMSDAAVLRHEATTDGVRLEDLWNEAIDALEEAVADAPAIAARALAEAQRLASDWGDDSDERAALAMLRAGGAQ